MRCLTLADAMRERGARCLFICRPHYGHLLGLIAERGHDTRSLPELTTPEPQEANNSMHSSWLGTDWRNDAEDCLRVLDAVSMDWLIVDHYAIDKRWEQAMHPSYKRLMVIDDRADREHACNLLLDQNLGRKAEDYAGLLESPCTKLIGPHYALLRPEFAQLREHSLTRRSKPQLQRLLITLGGVDKDNATGRVLDALNMCDLPRDLKITVVMGAQAPWRQQVQLQIAHMQCPTEVLIGVKDMAQLMSDSDLCIGAAGSTSWERCCLGLPSILLVLADNQQPSATALHDFGAALSIQNMSQIQSILNSQIFAKPNNSKLRNMSANAAKITGGNGTKMVSEILMTNHE
jgi:UDP-2,4-diacetamido-2,4,6-trideoxy-beta-L-altropyranose hydrolase